jgi:sirohydrochlorin cobaltochelatase
MAQQRAIILFGHGSRDPLWRQPIDAVAQRIHAAQPDLPVLCAFLELQPPDIATAAGELMGLGAGQITIVPMFLGTGRHAREDLPLLVEQLRGQHPAIDFVVQQPVGEDSRLLDLLAKIALA